MSFIKLPLEKFNTHELSPWVEDIIDNYQEGDTIEDIQTISTIISQSYTCCNSEMQYHDAQSIICLKCGCIKAQTDNNTHNYTNTLNGSYNTASSCHINFKVNSITKTGYRQNQYIKGSSDYNLLKRRSLFLKLTKWRNEINSNKDSFPINVINEVIDRYCSLQDEHNIVKRAGGLDAVLGELILEVSREYGAPRSSSSIASIVSLDAESFRAGNKYLEKFNNDKIINIVDNVRDYSIIYMQKLCIEPSERNLSFIEDLIHITSMEQMPASDNKALIRTRIVGAISILISEQNLRITKTTIQQETDISVSTFNKYIKFVKKYRTRRAVRLILEKHNILNL